MKRILDTLACALLLATFALMVGRWLNTPNEGCTIHHVGVHRVQICN